MSQPQNTLILFATICLLGIHELAAQATLLVPSQYSTIQEAIDSASTGDTVLVAPGNYLVNDILIDGKAIHLYSEGGYMSTSIDGQNQFRLMTIGNTETDTIYVAGFTFRNGDPLSNTGTVIRVDSGLVKFDSIIFEDSGQGTGNSLFLGSGIDKTFLTDAIVRNNYAENAAGVRHLTCTRCLIEGNSAWNNPSVAIQSKLINCTVYGNTGGVLSNPWTVGGLSTGCTAINCIVWGNNGHNNQQVYNADTVMYSCVQYGYAGNGNISDDPLFTSAGTDNFTLQSNSPCIDTGHPNALYNDPDGTRNDMGAYYFHQGSSGSGNYSLQFDGIDDFVDCGDPSTYTFGDMTLTCWFKTSAETPLPGSNYQGLVTKDCNGCGSDFSFLVGHTDNGDIAFTGEGMGYINSVALNDGMWHFVAGTRNGTTGLLNLYVDGVLVDSDFGGTGILSNSNNFHFGKYFPSNPHYYEGLIDNVTIWNVELSQAQIQEYMYCGPPNDAPGLLGFWNFNEGTGSITADQTTNGNDGTLLNGVAWSTDVPPCSVPDTCPVAWWPFNGNANDETGNGNDGTVYGATLTEDRFGNPNSAYLFDGSNDYIQGPNQTLTMQNQVTVTAWVNTSIVMQETVFELTSIGGVSVPYYPFPRHFQYSLLKAAEEDSNRIYFLATGVNDDFETNGQLLGDQPIPLDEWHHLAATYDGSSVKFYLDGALDFSSAISDNFYQSNYEVFHIGQRHEGGGPSGVDMNFTGKIDDIRIYNRSLSQSEIQSLMSEDADGDGHYAFGSCFVPGDDCDDANPFVYPDADELCDGIDNDCDGSIDEGLSTDADDDGHYTIGSCMEPADDCDDTDDSIYPGALELCNGIDNNCDSIIIINSLTVDVGSNCQVVYPAFPGQECVEITATVTGGIPPYTYSWVPGGDTTATISACPLVNTTFIVIVTDSNGCVAEDKVEVQSFDIGCKDGKVIVCHLANDRSLCVGIPSAVSHLNHGDHLGPCGGAQPCAGNSPLQAVGHVTSESDLRHPRDVDWDQDIHVFPNPTSDQVFVDLSRLSEAEFTVSIYNHLGKKIRHTIVQTASVIRFNVSNVPNGLYTVAVHSADGQLYDKKMVIQQSSSNK